jgi:CRISPR-associated protein Cas1
MATLYVQEQGATLRLRDNQALVTRDGQTLLALPLARVEQVVVMGQGVQLSTALLIDLLQRGVPVTLTDQHGSRHYATLTAGPSRFGELRLRQMALVQDPARALALARALVGAKLTNQRALLAATGWPGAASAGERIAAAQAALATAATVEQARGYEGAAAAAYFGAWRAGLPPGWGFAGRAFYPPPDPVNAVLSFGYTLVLHEVLTAVHLAGLDPYLGVFHALEPGRPSLALDLLEEFRPLLVDRLALELLLNGDLTPGDFERPDEPPGAVYLGAAGRARFIGRLQARLQASAPLRDGQQTALRRVIALQAQALARVVRGEAAAYTGYTPARVDDRPE